MTKVISYLTNSNQKTDLAVRLVPRTDLWFKTYRYMAKLAVNESNALRRLDHAHIDRVIRARRDWGRRIKRQPGSWHAGWEPLQITDEDVSRLHVLCDFFLENAGTHRITVGYNQLYVYTNDLPLIERLQIIPFVQDLSVSQIELKGDPQTVVLTKSDHTCRTYFKCLRLESETARSLRGFLAVQADLRLCPSLADWVESSSKLIKDHYFIDHDGLGILAMLGLIHPRLVRKTMPIVVAK